MPFSRPDKKESLKQFTPVLPYLQVLEICNSESLRHVHILAFRGLSSLKELKIHSVSIAEPPNLMFVKHTLEYLYIQLTQINKIPNLYFIGCAKIKMFVISYNHITTILDLSHVATTIEEIMISNNNIMDLNISSNSSFPQLRCIMASRNNISTVTWGMIEQMPVLLHLDLSENRLHQLPDITKMGMSVDRPEMLMVHIFANPWVCDRTMAWVLRGLTGAGTMKRAMFFMDIKIVLRTRDRMCCYLPPTRKGTALFDIGMAHALIIKILIHSNEMYSFPLAYKDPSWNVTLTYTIVS